jgi:hypothetical protein
MNAQVNLMNKAWLDPGFYDIVQARCPEVQIQRACAERLPERNV